jgi:hypothetical protein
VDLSTIPVHAPLWTTESKTAMRACETVKAAAMQRPQVTAVVDHIVCAIVANTNTSRADAKRIADCQWHTCTPMTPTEEAQARYTQVPKAFVFVHDEVWRTAGLSAQLDFARSVSTAFLNANPPVDVNIYGAESGTRLY